MKILVVSDSHGEFGVLQSIIDAEAPFDRLIHCGDGVRDLLHVMLPPGATVMKVAGNVDIGVMSGVERVLIEEIGGARVMIAHGDEFDAHDGLSGLVAEGRRAGCDVVIFGHTHRQHFAGEAPALFNPGAAQKGQYGVIESGGDLRFFHRRVARRA